MSKQLATAFFPSVTNLESKILLQSGFKRWLLNHLLPDYVALHCPEVAIDLPFSATTSLQVRHPVLLLVTIHGIWIGIGGAIRLYHRQQQQHHQQQHQKQQNLKSYSSTQSPLWIVAFLCFGLMNVSGLILHSFVPLHGFPTRKIVSLFSSKVVSASTSGTRMTTTYAQVSPWLWIMDSFMTGASSTALIFASLEEILVQRLNKNCKDDKQLQQLEKSKTINFAVKHKWITFLRQLYASVVIVVGLAYCCGTLWSDPNCTLPLELWYLLPTTGAGIPITRWWIMHMQAQPQQHHDPTESSVTAFTRINWMAERITTTKGLSIFLFGAILTLVGVPVDAPFCHLLLLGTGTSNAQLNILISLLMDFCTATTFVFLGCNVAFLGLFTCLHSQLVSTFLKPETNPPLSTKRE